jgi:GDSL-like Lipase/Acylhydrolase family
MNQLAYWNTRIVFCAAITALTCAACGTDDPNPSYGPMFPGAGAGVGGGGVNTLDASPVIVGDSGVPQPVVPGGGQQPGFDAGPGPVGPGPVIGSDAGPGPVIGTDSGPVVRTDGGPVVGTDAGPVVAPDSGMQRMDLGEGDGKDVITIGDSWMSYGSGLGIQESLEKVSKRDYRNFGVPGTKLLAPVGGSPAIPDQYKAAKMADPDIKTVVMTGGGNDILQEILLQCVDGAFAETCQAQIDKVAARLTTFWAEMAADGVQDVIVIGYSRKTNPLFLGTTSESIEYSAKKIDPLCAAVPAPLRCHSFDSDKAAPNLTFMFDGIHPDGAGYDAIATGVWELMKSKGMRR